MSDPPGTERLNTRVLVIDDEEAVLDGFRTVLLPRRADRGRLEAAASVLFAEDDAAPVERSVGGAGLRFEVVFASTGVEGIRACERALADDAPFAVVFCDMRMPGIDGLTTVERLRALDPRMEVVFVTAYSDYSLPVIAERAGANVGYFVKPFVTEEVLQLATKLVLDYNRARQLEALARALASLRGATEDLDALLGMLLREVCAWLDAPSAALLEHAADGYRYRVGVGSLAVADVARRLAGRFDDHPSETDIIERDGRVMLPVDGFGLVLAVPRRHLTPDRQYVLQVFLRHAALAIRNSTIQAELTEQRRMAAVGQAVAFILHDLRGPLGNAQMLLDLHLAGAPLPWASEATLRRVRAAVADGLAMLGETLDHCRGGLTATLTRTSVADALEGPLEVARVALASHEVRLSVSIPEGLAARLDAPLFQRAVQNVVRNAADAARRSHAQPAVHVSAWRTDDAVVVEVRDNGGGMSRDVQRTVFEPLASAAPEGVGFGLAIVKELVMLHEGRIAIDSRVGEGTAFRILLPVA